MTQQAKIKRNRYKYIYILTNKENEDKAIYKIGGTNNPYIRKYGYSTFRTSPCYYKKIYKLTRPINDKVVCRYLGDYDLKNIIPDCSEEMVLIDYNQLTKEIEEYFEDIGNEYITLIPSELENINKKSKNEIYREREQYDINNKSIKTEQLVESIFTSLNRLKNDGKTSNIINKLQHRSEFLFDIKSIEKIYDNQKEEALKIYMEFYKNGKVIGSLIAIMQLGKTGITVALCEKLVFEKILDPKDIYIITGMSLTEWRRQTKKRFPKIMHCNVKTRNDFKKLELKDIKNNSLFIIDESQFGSKEKSMLSDKIKEIGLENLEKRNIKILLVSATPDGPYLNMKKTFGKLSFTQKAKTPESYYGPKEMLENNQIYQALDLTDFDEMKKLIKEIESYKTPRYHLIRLPLNLDLQNKIENNLNYFTEKYDYKIRRYNQKHKDKIDLSLMKKPNKHNIILIKNKLRAAITIEQKQYLGILHDRYCKNYNVSVISQSFLGRMCGHNIKNKDFKVYTDKNSVKIYTSCYYNHNMNYNELEETYKGINMKKNSGKYFGKNAMFTRKYNNNNWKIEDREYSNLKQLKEDLEKLSITVKNTKIKLFNKKLHKDWKNIDNYKVSTVLYSTRGGISKFRKKRNRELTSEDILTENDLPKIYCEKSRLINPEKFIDEDNSFIRNPSNFNYQYYIIFPFYRKHDSKYNEMGYLLKYWVDKDNYKGYCNEDVVNIRKEIKEVPIKFIIQNKSILTNIFDKEKDFIKEFWKNIDNKNIRILNKNTNFDINKLKEYKFITKRTITKETKRINYRLHKFEEAYNNNEQYGQSIKSGEYAIDLTIIDFTRNVKDIEYKFKSGTGYISYKLS